MLTVEGLKINRSLYNRFMKTLKGYEVNEFEGDIPFMKFPHLVIEYSKDETSGRIVLFAQGRE